MARRGEWKTVEAEIVSCGISWLRTDYGNLWLGRQGQSSYIADYVYEVDGTTYRRSMHIGDPDQVGKIFEIEYDPDNPILNSAPDQTISLQDPKTWLGYVIGALAICLLLYLKAKIF